MTAERSIISYWPIAALGIWFLMAVTSPLWVLDKTPQANDQQPAIPLQKGWTKQKYQWDNGKKTPVLESNASYDVEVMHWLGTDILGRDIMSRMMRGLLISLFIGFWAIIVSLVIGTFVGAIAGFFGGWWDRMLLILINSLWSIPTILLVFALVLVLGRGMVNIILAIGLTMWVDVARLVRGLVLRIKQIDYVQAAQALGYKSPRIVWKHVLPGVIEPLIVLGTVNFATAILVEAGISYLGFGIQPPAPSLGQILAENYGYVLGGHYYKSLVPAGAIFLTVLLLNLSGSWLRDRLDVKSQLHT